MYMVRCDRVIEHAQTKAFLRLENPMQVPASVERFESSGILSVYLLNGLNGAKRLNGLNDLNGLRYLWRVASFFLEIAFSVQKATSKLLNNAFYATLCCQIKKLPWSDPVGCRSVCCQITATAS